MYTPATGSHYVEGSFLVLKRSEWHESVFTMNSLDNKTMYS